MFGLILTHPIIFKVSLTEAQPICGIMQKYFKYDKNIFSSAWSVRTFLTRSIRLSDGLVQPASLLKSSKLPKNLLVRHQQISKFDVNTNVLNNVILYKNENDGYFRIFQLFAIGQLFGWAVLAFYTYTPGFFDIFAADMEFMKEHVIQLSLFTCSIFVGPITFAFMYATCARNIKYVILNKGGKTISLFTYHIWKRKSQILNLPVGMARCTSHRTGRGVCIPVKIKNRSFYYMIDKNGTFVNPNLFDYTMG
ncbi:transmembrane protein 223 [Cataglyphis hispanica]|uniref:transmembrane protein 223 n=1 Tax=Cataglyphis hispanica TaxID=1086592 RepID=UPI00218077E2|nr:transmembrane protein 223 [Cataglyphis hispanica]XP_050465386.1 transmembrane protein 223 [Cataglyphis hispanica]